MDKILKRDDKLAFMALEDDNSSFTRLRGFTEFSMSKNPVEYSRRYIDEKNERSDVVGFSPTISYSFDRFSDDAVHNALVEITDSEAVGSEAVRRILIVDVSCEDEQKPAFLRNWSVIPDSEGDDADAYTYSGTLKSNGAMATGTATSTDNWLTCTFTPDNE